MAFLEDMLSYYYPGLDPSSLDEETFIRKMAHLLVIRQMEKNEQAIDQLKKLFK